MSSISGSSAYHLLIFSGLAILLFAALARRGSEPHGAADRWAIAAAMLLGLQGLRLATAAWAPFSPFLPLLDRLFSVLLPALLGWAALGQQAGGAADRILIAVVLAAGGLLAASALLGAAAAPEFNSTTFDQVWTFAALVVAGASLLAMFVQRPPQWAVFAGALAILLAGTLAHIATPPITASSAPYVLLAEALAIPICTVGAIWTFLREAQPTAAPSIEQPAWRGLAAFDEVERADSPTGYASSLTRAIGTLLKAEYCLLLTPPTPDDALSIGAGFDARHQARVLNVQLEPGGCPVLSQAIAHGRSVHLPLDTHSPDSHTLLIALGLEGSSPGLMVPLLAEGRAVAGLVLLSPREQRPWDDATRLALEQVTPAYGARLLRLMIAAGEGPTPTSLAHGTPTGRDAPPAELVGLDDLRYELDDARKAVEILQAELHRLRTAASAAPAAQPAEAERLQAELALALAALAESRSEQAAPERSGPPSTRRDPMSAIHGVRQPLTAIAGYTELLLGESIGLLGASQRRFLERIRTAVRRMDQELAALAEGLAESRVSPSPGGGDLATLVEQALEVIHEDLRAKGLSVRLDLPPLPLRVPGDPASVRTILSRLLVNAADVTPAGREVLLSLLPAGDGLALLTVSDVGPGVAPSDLGRVFSGEIWEDPIPGLGRDASALTLVKSLVEELGGRVWVENRPGGGTSFSVLLPTAAET